MPSMPESLRSEIDLLAAIAGHPSVEETLQRATAPARKRCGTRLNLAKPRYYWTNPDR